MDVYPRPAIWSSWCFGWDGSALGLVDSWNSTVQPYLIFGTFGDATKCRSRCQKLSLFFLVQGIAVPWVSPAFFFLHFSWSPDTHDLPDQWNRFLSIVEHYSIWVFNCPFLFFSILSGFSKFWTILRATHDLVMWSSEMLSISPWTTFFPVGGFSFNNVNFVKPLNESDKLLFKSTFQYHPAQNNYSYW